MVAGPFGAPGGRPEAERAANLKFLNEMALEVWRLGHVPIIGVNNALPLIEAAGAERYGSLMMPLSLALADRCDATLRVGGASGGADEEVARFRAAGKPVYFSLDELPAGA